MNYLAHAILSFENDDILLGNMISDYVKGKQKFTYTPMVQNGIALHREIDAFTDTHSALQPAKAIFQPTYRLYSSAIVDVVLDYFVANLVKEKTDLLSLTKNIYTRLAANEHLMPVRFQKMFPYMQEQNWLYNYQYDWGIEKSLTGLQRRAAYITEVDTAYHLFIEHKEMIQECFQIFWKDVQQLAAKEYKNYATTIASPLY